jgi:uncharacterized LabA/DUF88 family protein
MIITTEAMKVLYTQPIDGLILAASDVDYTPLVTCFREAGKEVIGVGKAETPQCLRRLYDRFFEMNGRSGHNGHEKKQVPVMVPATHFAREGEVRNDS